MFKVCIIDPNQVSFSTNDNLISKFTLDDIEDYLEDYVKIQKIQDNVEFMNTILKEIDGNENMTIYTTNFYEYDNIVYQMYHLSTYNEDNYHEINKEIKKKKKNGVANILTDFEFEIYGKVVISKSKINADNSVTYLELTLRDIYEVFRNKKIQKGLLVKVNNTLEEIEFINHPLSWIQIDKGFNYKFYEIQVFDKILMFFIQINPENNNYNKFASELFRGNNPINGDVYIVLRNKVNDIRFTENVYVDLNKDLFYKLREVFLNDNFINNQEPLGYNHETLKYENFYSLLNNIYKNTIKENINNTIKEYRFDENKESLNTLTKAMTNK